MSTSSGYWVSENGTSADKDNVFYERVRSYNPVTKMVQLVDTPLSPRAASPSPGYQSPATWSPEPHQVHHVVQEVSPNYTQGTLRRYLVQNSEPEVSPNYTQGTLRRYLVQNSEPELQSGTVRRYIVQNPEPETQTPYQHETIRRYIVQNPEQQAYLKGVNYIPGNNVIYEKTIRRVEKQTPELEKQITISKGSTTSSVNEQVIEQVSVQSEQEKQINISRGSNASYEQVIEQDVQKKVSFQTEQKRSVDFGPEQLDAKYFGELLADLSRKNNDLYSCLMQHVEKIGARKPSDSEYQSADDIESLIPKGVSELTKQQIRYLLQMRQTSDKSMRLVLSTFSSLREELAHLQNDLNKLEFDKKALERDLTFKDTQINEYEAMLQNVREKNRQQQQELKESALKLRSLDETILSFRNAEADKDYRLKELEYAKNALQQEIQTLRLQVSDTCSSSMLQTKTDEISRHYKETINSLRDEKDKEIRTLRSQISKFQHDVSAREGSSSDLQMRLLELTASLEERESLIKRQQEELFRLRHDRDSKNVTNTVVTQRYRTQYPILRLLSDQPNTPFRDTETVVIERTGETRKQEYFTRP
ncbi:protein POF1B isoform X4 [Bombina bombina]|uniref:protein POF1B isoform X4 n=1 Tax=Bombina bombina TaxID=8345 RepID=UPI00235ADA19|nr:protein POF1B isoform X4 [Bombina bombina]